MELSAAIEALKPGERLLAELHAEEYHAMPAVSSGFVRSMLDVGEWTTYHAYIKRDVQQADSDAMRLGRIFHAAAPDPRGLLERLCVLPTMLQNDMDLATIRRKWAGRTKASLQPGDEIDSHIPAHREYIAAKKRDAVDSGRLFSTEDEAVLQQEQIASVMDNPQIAYLFGNRSAKYEQVGFYRDIETGLLLKGMADVLVDDLVVDFKTTRHHTKQQFLRASLQAGMRVDLQCAHYCRVFGKQRAAVVAVRNFRPTESMWYEIPSHYLRQADIALSMALEKIHQCFEIGSWHSDGWAQQNYLEPDRST